MTALRDWIIRKSDLSDTPSIPAAKAALRGRMKRMLRTIPPPLPDACRPVADWLRTHPQRQTVAIFAPLPGEPDLLRLLELLPGRTWCFPRVLDDQRLAFHQVGDPSTLRPAAFDVREPAPDSPMIPAVRIDAFLCPGLAFDRTGGRLGRGRGYYDRLLAGARADAVKVGSCFACQLVDTTFTEPHDVRMDVVICETGVATPAE